MHSATTLRKFANAAPSAPESTNAIRSNSHVSLQNEIPDVLLATAVIKVQTSKGSYIYLRVLLDQGSQASLITENAAQRLGLPRFKCQEAEFNLIKRVETAMDKQHKSCNQHINALEREMKERATALQYGIKMSDFILSSVIANGVLSSLKSIQETLTTYYPASHQRDPPENGTTAGRDVLLALSSEVRSQLHRRWSPTPCLPQMPPQNASPTASFAAVASSPGSQPPLPLKSRGSHDQGDADLHVMSYQQVSTPVYRQAHLRCHHRMHPQLRVSPQLYRLPATK
ncbi:unnamed protein product [Leptidea sinapis]|uniref:Peptidase aspartic putative domain-containing protein n=1 Tax=Leptidea sinapis TaxID=189913 RepID=A0A5E4PS81_9NEOP|nr:unnamed protein product [Leptidea sinapis]